MTPRHRKLSRYTPDQKRRLKTSDARDNLPPRGECPTPTKVCYATRKEAKRNLVTVKGIGKAEKPHVHAYMCVCNRFHLGSVHDLEHLRRIREGR